MTIFRLHSSIKIHLYMPSKLEHNDTISYYYFRVCSDAENHKKECFTIIQATIRLSLLNFLFNFSIVIE